MGFIEDLKSRNLLAQVTHEQELISHLASGRRTAYAGFDPTGDSLHVGHLLPVMALRRWQKAGHRAIALLGGGTAMVGDPTGKTEMRSMMTMEEIDRRAGLVAKQLGQLLDFSTPDNGVVVNNSDWLRGLEYLTFLRDFGSQFSVNRMLTAESVKQRLEKGLSFLEFNYMILQSYDFYHLYNQYECTVQLGGDDQWSNMLGGMDLVRRKEGAQAFCVTVPLLVTNEGKKMGKTEKGAVWIDPDMTSPYDFFQFFRNTPDDMVEKCLFYFTDLPVDEVKRLAGLKDQAINEAKVVLAYEVTKIIHGEEEAKKSRQAAAALFSGSAEQSATDAPQFFIDAKAFGGGMNVIDLLLASKIFTSKSEVRRLIEQGGLSINGEKVTDFGMNISLKMMGTSEGLLIKKGKKHYYYLKITP